MFEIILFLWILLPIPLFILWILAKRKVNRTGINYGKLPKLKDKGGLELVGFYHPEFEYSDSDRFKEAIIEARDNQKAMITAKTAVVASTEWTVGGSRRKGKQMTDRAIKLCLRTFNNECEAAISKVKWSNISAMQTRISKAYDQINKLNDSNHVAIAAKYLELKLRELHLQHRYREKQKDERDHKAEMNRQKREEDKLLRDAAKAEKEEEKYLKLLVKAKKDALSAVGPEAVKYEAKIAQLIKELEAAHQATERAKSMAEQTRAGYIYVISNIGSFGEGVYKIGMTRRLEPMDRVKELGDASVPFTFDVHALFYCEDAPKVESNLHKQFDDFRVNKANNRKEFFKVPLTEIERSIHSISPDADLITDVEAQEYRQTMMLSSDMPVSTSNSAQTTKIRKRWFFSRS